MLLLSLLLLTWFYFSLPKKIFDAPTSYIVEDSRGNLLNATIATDGQWRFPERDTLPEKFVACITSFEDRRFFYHPGVDRFPLCGPLRKIFSVAGLPRAAVPLPCR